MGMKNYVFAAKCPTENLDEIDRQMRLAHAYRNKLAELEIERRKRCEATLIKLSPEYAEKAAEVAQAQAVYDDVVRRIKEASQKARRKVPLTPELETELAAAKKAKKKAINRSIAAKSAAFGILNALLKPLRKQGLELAKAELPEPLTEELREAAIKKGTWTPAKVDKLAKVKTAELIVQAGLDDYDRWHHDESVKARKASGCYWGNYGYVEDSMRGVDKGPPPRFKKYDGSGAVCVSPETGGHELVTVASAQSSEGEWLQLSIPNEEALVLEGNSRGAKAVGLARLRIGTRDKAPLWASIPVVFCRYMPPNSRIAKVFIHKRMVGTKAKWSVRITLNIPDDTSLPEGDNNQLVAVHPGWRMMPRGDTKTLRVCTTLGSDGCREELELGSEQIDNYTKLADLDSERDLLMNEMQDWMAEWISTTKGLPEWFYAETATIGFWRSQNRFLALGHLWRKYLDYCFSSEKGTPESVSKKFGIRLKLAEMWIDDIPFPETSDEVFQRFAGYRNGARDLTTCSWLVRDSLLYDHQANLSERLVFRRRDIYRKFARTLARKYQYCVLANINWAQLLRSDELGPAHDPQTKDQRRNGRIASPGELWRYVKEAFAGRAIIVKSEEITLKHAECGSLQEFDRKHLMHTCTQCGIAYDQDHNGCANQLEYADVVIQAAGGLAKAAALPPPSKLKPRIDPVTGEELPPVSRTKTRGRRAKPQKENP